MAETDAAKNAVNDFRKGQGNKITYHSADPGTNGANLITTSPTSANTTWGSSSISGGISEVVGSEVQMTVPPSTPITHLGQWNGATFIRGIPLSGSISAGPYGSVPVGATPKLRYGGNT